MYWSFNHIPEVRGLPAKEKRKLYRTLARDLAIGSNYSRWMMLSFICGVIVAAAIAKVGGGDNLVGWGFLGVSLCVWMLGYIKILNIAIAPRAIEIIASRRD